VIKVKMAIKVQRVIRVLVVKMRIKEKKAIRVNQSKENLEMEIRERKVTLVLTMRVMFHPFLEIVR